MNFRAFAILLSIAFFKRAQGSEVTKCYFGKINGQNTCFLDGITYNPEQVKTTISNRTNPSATEGIERVEIIHSKISCIPTEIFLVFKSLKTLVITDGNTNLDSLEPNSLNGATKLGVLKLNNNNINKLVSNNFIKARGLKVLDLAWNKITDVNPHTFTGLDQLDKLNLNNNQISILKSNTLMGLFNLKELRLSYNKIKKIEPQALRYNKKLLLITFAGNQCINKNFVPYKFPENEPEVYIICDGGILPKQTIIIQEVPETEHIPSSSNRYQEVRRAPESRVMRPQHLKPTQKVKPLYQSLNRRIQSSNDQVNIPQDNHLPVNKDPDYFHQNNELIENTLAKAEASIKRFEDMKLGKPFYYLELDNFHKIEEPPTLSLH